MGETGIFRLKSCVSAQHEKMQRLFGVFCRTKIYQNTRKIVITELLWNTVGRNNSLCSRFALLQSVSFQIDRIHKERRWPWNDITTVLQSGAL